MRPRALYQEVRAKTNPLGVRGLGEYGNPGLGAAIANAVADALGLKPVALPITPSSIAFPWTRAPFGPTIP